MLTTYIIFMLSLVCAEKMWYFSEELRMRRYGRKVEVLTMVAGCIFLGIGEVVNANNHIKCAMQCKVLEETVIAYAMLIFLAGAQLMAASEAMKKYKRTSDKLIIWSMSFFCLLLGGIIGLI